MKTDSQFWCAWIEDTDVLAVWDLVVERILMPVWTVVTMLESNERVAELTAVKQRFTTGDHVASLGDPVLFDPAAFASLRVHGDNFFTGYDEIWMAHEMCESLEKPPHLRISAEQAISEAPVDGLDGGWRLTGCALGSATGLVQT